MKYFQKATSKDMLFISQNSVIIKNTLDILKDMDINSSDKLEEITGSFPISSKDGEFRAVIDINPINSININDFLENNKTNPNIDRLLDFLAYKYDIKDILYLKDLILDTIDKDLDERSTNSEIILQNPLFQNSKIYNYDQFKTILNYYVKATDDKNVYKVPWKEYFNFEFTQLYEPNKDILSLNEQNETKFNIISIEKAKHFFIKIGIQYAYTNEQNISILYDLKTKKAKKIENYPLY